MSFGQLGTIILGGEFEVTHSIEQGLARLLTDNLPEYPVRRRRSQNQAYPVITYEVDGEEYPRAVSGRTVGVGEMRLALTVWVGDDDYDLIPTIGKALRALLNGYRGLAWDRTIHGIEFDTAADLPTALAGDGTQKTIYARTFYFIVHFKEE